MNNKVLLGIPFFYTLVKRIKVSGKVIYDSSSSAMYRFQSIDFILIGGTPPIGSAKTAFGIVRPLIL